MEIPRQRTLLFALPNTIHRGGGRVGRKVPAAGPATSSWEVSHPVRFFYSENGTAFNVVSNVFVNRGMSNPQQASVVTLDNTGSRGSPSPGVPQPGSKTPTDLASHIMSLCNTDRILKASLPGTGRRVYRLSANIRLFGFAFLTQNRSSPQGKVLK